MTIAKKGDFIQVTKNQLDLPFFEVGGVYEVVGYDSCSDQIVIDVGQGIVGFLTEGDYVLNQKPE